MDKLPHSLLLQILSRLDDSADVARCRVASKSFNSVFPGLRSMNLRCSIKWYNYSNSMVLSSPVSQYVTRFKSFFLDFISKLETVESVSIDLKRPFFGVYCDNFDFNLTDVDFAKEWLPRVSGSLTSLSLSDDRRQCQSSILQLISAYCHDLVNLKLECAFLSVHKLSPMPMLTNLVLEYIELEDENLNEFNKCFPNLQVLNLVGVTGLRDPKISLLNLKTCIWAVYSFLPSLTLVTPNLVTLRIECFMPATLHVEAPMLSHFHLGLNPLSTISPLLVDFIMSENDRNIDNVTLDSGKEVLRAGVGGSRFIRDGNVGHVSQSFMSKCMARWSGLKWRWGIWNDDVEDYWVVDGTRVVDGSNEHEQWFVPVHSSKFNQTNKRKREIKRTEFFVRVGSFEKDVCLCLDKRK